MSPAKKRHNPGQNIQSSQIIIDIPLPLKVLKATNTPALRRDGGGAGHDNIMTRIAVGPFTLSSVIQLDIFVLRKTEDSLYNNIYQYLDNFYCISTRYARVR